MDGPSDDVCHNCGEQLQPSDNFCPSCGTETPHSDSTVDREVNTNHTRGAARYGGGDSTTRTGFEESPASDRSSPGRPGTAKGIESALRTVGVAVALVVTAMLVPLVGLSVVGVALIGIGLPSSIVLVGMALLQFIWFGVFALWYLRYRGYDWDTVKSYFGVEVPSLKDLGLILVTWFVMIILAAIVGTLLVQLIPEIIGTSEQPEPAENQVNQIIENNPEIVFGAIAFMFLVVGPTEELLFRGVVQNRLREQFSMVPGIVLASALFAVVHVLALASTDPVGISITITVLFVTSLGLGWIYEYTGNIVVPSLLHGFHNSVIVAITAADALYDFEESAVILVEIAALVPL